MQTLKEEAGSEGQDYSLFFQKTIPGPNGPVENKFYWGKWSTSRYKEVMESYERLEGIDDEIRITVSKATGFARMWSWRSTKNVEGYRVVRVIERVINTSLAWTPNTFSEITRNIEAMGFAGPDIDAEIILMGQRLWDELGLKGVRLEINSLGQANERSEHRAALVAYFDKNQEQLDDDSQRRLLTNPLRILILKIQPCRS
jgi:hypothetical protein